MLPYRKASLDPSKNSLSDPRECEVVNIVVVVAVLVVLGPAFGELVGGRRRVLVLETEGERGEKLEEMIGSVG